MQNECNPAFDVWCLLRSVTELEAANKGFVTSRLRHLNEGGTCFANKAHGRQ